MQLLEKKNIVTVDSRTLHTPSVTLTSVETPSLIGLFLFVFPDTRDRGPGCLEPRGYQFSHDPDS